MRLLKYILPLLLAVPCLAQSRPIRNDTPTALRDLGANLNVGANFAVNQYGQLQCVVVAGDGAATSAAKLEDTATTSGHAGISVFAVREDALTASTSTSGDYSTLKVDAVGRLITSEAPPGESWQGCGTATAVTTDVAIKSAVISNRIYVTSITCKNTSATTATSLDFKDGTTVMAVGGISQMATTAPGAFTATFPVPLRGTGNTAFNFATNVSVSSVTCCAAGYISVS